MLADVILHNPVWVDQWLWYTIIVAGTFLPIGMAFANFFREDYVNAFAWGFVWLAFFVVMIFGVGLNGCLSHYGCTQ